MHKIIMPNQTVLPVFLEWTDEGGKHLVVADHPRSAGWTAHALRTAPEITVERVSPTRRVRRTVTSFKVSRPGRSAIGCVFIKIPDFTSLPFTTIPIPKNN